MNRRPLWVDLRHVAVNKRLPYLSAARAAAVDAILVAKDDAYATRTDLPIRTVDAKHAVRDGPKAIGKIIHLRNAADQKRAATAKELVIVQSEDWRVIPLENLIAQRKVKGTLYARASCAKEAILFADTLQLGADGIVLAPEKPADIADVHAELLARPVRPRPLPTKPPTTPMQQAQPTQQTQPIPAAPPPTSKSGASGSTLAIVVPSTAKRPAATQPPLMAATRPRLMAARITAIEDAKMGDRVCIDTTSMLADGEGILVGGTAGSLALVLAETAESQFIASRPFRVNAGAVSNYVLTPEGNTLYLSEMRSGRLLLATTRHDQQRDVTVGRAKIEKRPHLLLRWTTENSTGHIILQTAETVALCTPEGRRLPVTHAKVGDLILVQAAPKARHAGTAVDADAEER
jgi:3-dehydroquinate synthase II